MATLDEPYDFNHRFLVYDPKSWKAVQSWRRDVAKELPARLPNIDEEIEPQDRHDVSSIGTYCTSGRITVMPANHDEQRKRTEALFQWKMRGRPEIHGEDTRRHSGEMQVVVQDRSKSKSARVREEAKKKRKIHVKPLSRNKTKDKALYPRGKGPFVDLIDRYRYSDHPRGRIVIPSRGAGIFGKGASSGQYFGSDKRLHNQTAKEMTQGSVDRQQRETTETSSISTSSDEAELTRPERIRLGHKELERKIDKLMRTIDAMKKSRRKGPVQEEETVVAEPSSEDTGDGHSAYSQAQRAKKRAPHEERTSQTTPLEEPEDIAAKHSERSMAPPPSSSPAMPNAPPPLLAFDGNRPHQHPNAWRGQHTRHEPDWREIREVYNASGGPELRSRRPLDFLINDMNKENVAWEVLPGDYPDVAEYGAGYTFYNHKRYWKEQGNFDMPPPQQPMYEEQRGEERQEVDYDESGETEWLDGNDPFAEYIDYDHNKTGTNQGVHPNLSAADIDMYGHNGEQGEDSWLDEEKYMDQYEPEATSSMTMYDLRSAVQPTKDELSGFWKPQQHY